MKILLYALLFALVPYAHSMDSTSSNDQDADSYIIINNNTPFDLWFSLNAGGNFKKIGESEGKEVYKRATLGTSIFCDKLHAGAHTKTSGFTQGAFLTAKVAQNKDSLAKSNEMLTVKMYKPEETKNIALLSLEYLKDFRFDFLVKKKDPKFCYLCLESFQKNDEINMLAPCGHSFHIDCYNPVQKKRAYVEKSQYCPCCEQFIDIDKVKKIVID